VNGASFFLSRRWWATNKWVGNHYPAPLSQLEHGTYISMIMSFVIWIISLICNPLLYLVHRYGSTFPALTAEKIGTYTFYKTRCAKWLVPIQQLPMKLQTPATSLVMK